VGTGGRRPNRKDLSRNAGHGRDLQIPPFVERRHDTKVREAYEWQVQRVKLPAGEFGMVVFFNDLTERLEAEKVRQRVRDLAADNRKANREIKRRRIAEVALIKSEQVQRGLLTESRALHGQLRQLTRKIISAQEDERRSISRALHDEVMQILVSIDVELAILGQAVPKAGADLPATIAHTHDVVESAIKAVHQFARDLRPSVLDDFGLVPALRAHIKLLEQRHKLKVTLRAFRGADRLDGEKLTVLFRIAQEALANIVRHAGASSARITLLRVPGGIRLQVSDDGRAFRVTKVTSTRSPGRLGLVGMKERAEMVGGTLKITSIAGRGTTVAATLPLKDSELRTAQD
jgi:signal transduction histidine kinase